MDNNTAVSGTMPNDMSESLLVGRQSGECSWESVCQFLERSPARRHTILFALCLCNACDAVATMSIGFILNQLGDTVSDFQKTFLAAAVFVGMSVGGLIAGYFANRYGRTRTLVVALFFEGVAALAGALLPTMNAFIASRIISGVAIGATIPVLFILCPEVIAPTKREAYLTYVTGSFALGSIFAGLLAYLCFQVLMTSWQLYYGLTALFPLLTAAIVYQFVPQSPIHLARNPEQFEEFKESLSYLHPGASETCIQNVAAFNTDWGLQEKPSTSGFVESMRDFFTEDRSMKFRLMVISFAIAWVFYGLSMWTVSMFENLGMDDPYLSSLFFTICGTVGSLTCIAFVQSVGMKPYILATFSVATVSCLLGIFLESAGWAIALACITNTAISGLFNAVTTYQSVVPLHDRPLSMGFFGATARVGSIGAQFLMGYFQAADTLWIIHGVNALLLGVGMLNATTLPKINTVANYRRFVSQLSQSFVE